MVAIDRRKTVLVVEDQLINRRIVRKILEKDYDVIEAEHGAQALRLLQSGDVDALISDIIMPVMDGYELISKLRSNGYVNLPVIVMTSESDQETEQRALDLGAWDFVTKPIQPKVLLSRLRNAIGRSQTAVLEQLRYVYEHDPLTGMFNRTKVFREIRTMLDEHPEEQFVFCRLDIDRFHLYNASLGEAEGDKLLKHIADLAEQVVGNDVKNAVFGRLEADVFCICTVYHPDILRKKIDFVLNDLLNYRRDYLLEPSFGIYVVEEPDLSVETMLTRATMASQKCKNQYMTYIGYYDKSMDARSAQEQEIVNEMQAALDERQFVVYLQPKYSLKNNCPCGAEALVRWKHPQKGLISPGLFIPVFERNGFIAKLDYYMWEHVCMLLNKWQQEWSVVYPVSVNMSRISLYNPGVVELLIELVQKYHVQPELFQLELTESAYMSNPELMKSTIQRLQEAGFTILMDDFGSGYSSLNTLKEIDVDILKIDMKFLPTGHDNVKSEKILASVLRMANWLGIPVVVEGVETSEQREFLKSIGCYYVQGYYYARPMPVMDYEALMQSDVGGQCAEVKSSYKLEEIDNLWSSAAENNALMDAVSVPFAIYDFTNNFMEVIRKNTAFIDEFEYDEESYERHLPFADLQRLRGICEEAVHSQSIAEGDCLFILREGRSKWYRVRIQYIKTVQASIILCGLFMEITAEKSYEKELKQILNMLRQTEGVRTKILVIDDAEMERKMLAENFCTEYEILEAADGKEGLNLLKENLDQIEIIILDLIMPNMGGEQFLQFKNRISGAENIPVIIVSAEGNPGTQIEMLRNGVNDYVVKPVVPELLKKRIKNVLEYNSRFRCLVEEYQQLNEGAALTKKTKEKDSVFTPVEIVKYVRFMEISFDVVRLVDPRSTAVITFDEDGGIVKTPYSCFQVWNKDIRCSNCSSMCAEYEGCQKSKYEFIQNNIFYVISRPIHIVQKDNTIFPCVLEIVSHVSDHLLMEKVGDKTMRQLLEETQQKIYVDELTQVFNRRYFNEMLFLHREQNELSRQVAFIMVDIDNFKHINDQYGHAVGDTVLIDVAKELHQGVRHHDSVIRFGGDEFLVVLTNCSENAAVMTSERLSKAIARHIFETVGGLSVTASFGSAYSDQFQPYEDCLQGLLKAADSMMYQNKMKRKAEG